jgi:AcrR family transcriptional regulator
VVHLSFVTPRPKAPYHHGDLRAALVQAAVEMAEEEGIEAISTRALARKVGVSHAAPARHFPDRSSLLAAIAAEAFDRFGRVVAKAGDAEPAAKKKLAAMGRAYVRFGIDHPALIRLIFSPLLDALSSRPQALLDAGNRAFETLERGVRSSLGPSASDEKIALGALTAWSSVHGLVTLWLDGPLRHSLPEQGRRGAFLAMADAAVDATSRTVSAL